MNDNSTVNLFEFSEKIQDLAKLAYTRFLRVYADKYDDFGSPLEVCRKVRDIVRDILDYDSVVSWREFDAYFNAVYGATIHRAMIVFMAEMAEMND